MPVDQVFIALLGAGAAWLSQDRRVHWQRWACVFGLVGSPFWFYATWKAAQWGMFAVSLLYTVRGCVGCGCFGSGQRAHGAAPSCQLRGNSGHGCLSKVSLDRGNNGDTRIAHHPIASTGYQHVPCAVSLGTAFVAAVVQLDDGKNFKSGCADEEVRDLAVDVLRAAWLRALSMAPKPT